MLAKFHRSLTAPSDDPEAGFALIYAVLLITVIALLSIVVLSLAVNEIKPTQFLRKRAQTLDSAQSGIDAGLSMLRNAKVGTSTGVTGKLPCNAVNHDEFTGAVDAAGKNTYLVDVYYFGADPSTLRPVDPSVLTYAQVSATPAPTGLLTCSALASGTTPNFAYLESQGKAAQLPGVTAAGSGNRTLHGTYQFTATNVHSVGAQISYNSVTGNNCWDAGTPAKAGNPVTWLACGPLGTPSQLWLYRPDLSIQWAGDTSKNLCLDYSNYRQGGPNTLITLQTCIGNGTYASAWNTASQSYTPASIAAQEFGQTAGFIGVVGPTHTSGVTGDRDPNSCIMSTLGTGVSGDQLAMVWNGGGCQGGVNTDVESPGLGSGAAGGYTTGLPSSTTQQLVSYANGSRCINVRNSRPIDNLITFPCHESPNVNDLEQNERFDQTTTVTAGVPTPITTVRNAPQPGVYPTSCFQSDHTTSQSDGPVSNAGYVVTVVSCTGGASQQWTFAGNVSGDYFDSYTIKDSAGYCLTQANTPGVAGVSDPDGYTDRGFTGLVQETYVYSATCTGGDNQKWNAPAGTTNSPLKGFGEDVHN